MKDQQFITKSRLVRDMKRLGISEGQTVMLHVSVRNIGWVVGGPDVVLEAILEILSPSGTLMMMVSWEDNPYDLPHWPKQRQEAYLRECPAFDPEHSRADRKEMSIISEYLRTRPGAYRSRHPFSYAAIGKNAYWITKDHPWQYRDGHGSPLAKLCELEGWVLLLGSPLSDVTLLHHAEYLARIPNKRIDRYRMPLFMDGRKVWMDFEEYDTTNGIVDWPVDYFESIVKQYIDHGNGQKGKIGASDSYFFDAKLMVAFAVTWMEEHFAGSGGNLRS